MRALGFKEEVQAATGCKQEMCTACTVSADLRNYKIYHITEVIETFEKNCYLL